MSWALQRRYSAPGTAEGSGLLAVAPPAQAPLLPFPGMRPRYPVPAPAASSAAALLPPRAPVHQAPPPSPLPAAIPATPQCHSSQGLQTEASSDAACVTTADEEQLQSMLSALRVALSKKEAALVSIAGQLAEAQGRLQGCEGEKRDLLARVHDLQLAMPEPLPAACSVTQEGKMLAQLRQEVGREAARAADLAAERDALQQDVALLQQQLMAAAQAEATERERLCTEATQSRLLARARARQMEQLQTELQKADGAHSSASAAMQQQAEAAAAEAAAAKAAAAGATARAEAAEALATQLRQQLERAKAQSVQAEGRAAQADAELADVRQHADWQALRIAELEQTSSVGQLMRKYEGEMQRLHAQFEADRRELQEHLAQARQQAQAGQQAGSAAAVQIQECSLAGAGMLGPVPDSADWAALFDEEPSQQVPAEVQDAWVQTDDWGPPQEQPPPTWADPALLDAARAEIEGLQTVNASLLESQTLAQKALQDEQERQRSMALARQHEQSVQQAALAECQVALDAARRREGALQERLTEAQRQVARQAGEAQALCHTNEEMELAIAALKEELREAAGQLPLQEVEHLQAELRRAVAHTDCLEAQVQQLKQQASAAAQQHEAAVQQQVQQGAADAAAQVAAAVQAFAVRHEQEEQELRARLAEAHQQLQAACSELSELQQEQLLRRQGLVDQGLQASCFVDTEHVAVQTIPLAQTPAQLCNAAVQTDVAAGLVAAAAAATPGPSVRQPPTRGGSACETSSFDRSTHLGHEPAAPSVAVTAKQLQLELAKVRIAPLKPLASAGSGLRLAGLPPPSPSRLGSAYGEHGGLGHQAWGRSSSGYLGGPADRQLARSVAVGFGDASSSSSSSSGHRGRMQEEEDDCFATPLARTPTGIAGTGTSPFSGMLSPAASDGAAGWGDRLGPALATEQQEQRWHCSHPQQQHQQQQSLQQQLPLPFQGQPQQPQPQPQQQQQRQQQQASTVPPLDLRLVRPFSSLSCDSLGGEDMHLPAAGGSDVGHSQGGASTSASSLSSLGPSASQLASWTPATDGGRMGSGGLLPPGPGLGHAGTECAAATAAAAEGSVTMEPAIFSCIGGSTWQSASLDASLARLAALTAGLRRH